MFNKTRSLIGRGKRIRTSGPCLPKTVLYQAELFPDRCWTPAGAQGRSGPIVGDPRGGKPFPCFFAGPPRATWPRRPGPGALAKPRGRR